MLLLLFANLLFALTMTASRAHAAPDLPRHPLYEQMLEAATGMREAERAIFSYKYEKGLFDDKLDPNHTGLIGAEFTRITSTMGSLKAKRTASNPDFAALIVRELADHGIDNRDRVLITMTGSLPGLNLAVLMAIEILEVNSLRMVSLGASSYGANQEECTWLHMEDILVKAGLLNQRSNWVTLGASGDLGRGLADGGRKALKKVAESLRYPVLIGTSVEQHAAARRELVGNPKKYSLLINIGGNSAVLGKGGRELPGGWVDPGRDVWRQATETSDNGIVFDFLRAGVPVLNLLHVETLANAAGLPVDPRPMPPIGEAPIYFLHSQNGNTP